MPATFERHLTGISVPVTALKSRHSEGIGEFLDLIPLAEWCKNAGVDLIQLLPINDTGFMASPYSAYSAFALHPVYLRLSRVAGTEPYAEDIRAFAETLEAEPRVQYERVLRFKLDVLRQVFADRKEEIAGDASLQEWISANGWIKPYAVFYQLRGQYNNWGWLGWPAHQNDSLEDIEQQWSEMGTDVLFYAWLQRELERQLLEARAALQTAGILLKGDIPILMNDDSADVWAYRPNFNLQMRAGAPPDVFATTGQHWGFPTYNWRYLERTRFAWWKDRLEQAEKFFDAYRIDHVLGFFRIWSIPSTESTALLAHYEPNAFMTHYELLAAGFDAHTIRLISKPWTTAQQLQDALGSTAQTTATTYFEPETHGVLFLKPAFANEPAIFSLPEPEATKQFLLSLHRDRALLEPIAGRYAPFWYIKRTRGFQRLTEDRQRRLLDLVEKHKTKADAIWWDQGLRLLSMLREATPMIPCAEDLGAVPDCVPDVLEMLDILSLKIERWIGSQDASDGPLMHPKRYPLLSVCTPGVHDTNSLRGWWLEDGWQKREYYHSLGFTGEPPATLTPDIAERILIRNLETNSLLCIFQIQDLFILDPDLLMEDASEERINIPGTVGDHNWSYRLPTTLEALTEEHADFTSIVQRLVRTHRTAAPRPEATSQEAARPV